MQPDVAETRRRRQAGRRHRIADDRLIDVAEGEIPVGKQSPGRLVVPRSVAELDGRRPSLEEAGQAVEQPVRGRVAPERPGKLEEPRADAAGLLEGGEGVDEPPHRSVVGRPLVRDAAPRLHREEESGEVGDPLRPAADHPLAGNPVEGVVELDAVDVAGDETQAIDAAPGRVDRADPVGVRPPRRADVETFDDGILPHASIFGVFKWKINGDCDITGP